MESARHEDRLRATVRSGGAVGGAARRLHPALRPHRTRRPGRRARPARSDEEEAVRELIRRAAARSASAPSPTCATTTACAAARRHPRSPTWWTRVTCDRSTSRLGSARLPAHRRPHAAPDHRRRAAVPVRSAGVLPSAHPAVLRLPLPDRDLHPRTQTGARLLRVPAARRRQARRPGGSAGRTRHRPAARARRVRRARLRHRSRSPRRCAGRCGRWRTGSNSTKSLSATAAISPRCCDRDRVYQPLPP